MDVKHEVMYTSTSSYATSTSQSSLVTNSSDEIKSEMKRHSPCYTETESRPGGHVLFQGIVGVKRLRTDDWLSTKNSLISSNPVSPLTTSSPSGGGGPTSTPYSVISTNGYSSPTESYPYSPNEKRKFIHQYFLIGLSLSHIGSVVARIVA
ncbi:hypothetical protein M8J77_016803 [Diaphorina citri]|nr:hypothetical protein M8J77_016803 [Diaphorina citri]